MAEDRGWAVAESGIRDGATVSESRGTCKWCARPCADNSTECDRCWELRTRVERDPELAGKMVAHNHTVKLKMIQELSAELSRTTPLSYAATLQNMLREAECMQNLADWRHA